MRRERAPAVVVEWLEPVDLARELEISRQYASRLIRRIPGAEQLYAHERGQRWRVSRADFDAWRLVSKVSKVDNGG